MDDSASDNVTTPATNTTTTTSRWILLRAFRELWRTLRDDCRALSRRVWLRWGITLAIGFVGCGLLSHVVTRLARASIRDGLQTWDERMLMKLADEGPMSFPNAVLLESPGNLSYLIPLTIVASVIAIRRRAPLTAISIQVAYWLQRPIVIIGWQTWDRARPTLIGEGIAAPGLHAFPSGHAALSVAVYGFLTYLWIRASRSNVERMIAVTLVTLLTVLVSLARVRLGSHWPSDVIAGAFVGIGWVSVVIVAHRNAMRTSRAV